MKILINNRLVDRRRATIPYPDRSFLLGDGIFETMRVYGGKVFACGDHLKRLRGSARLTGIRIPFTDAAARTSIKRLLTANRLTEAVIRLTVSRGGSYPGLVAKKDSRPLVIVDARRFKPYPGSWYSRGVSVAVVSVRRTPGEAVDTRIKSCSYLNNILARLEAHRTGAVEGIMLNMRGEVTEGSTSNVYIVKRGRVITAPLSAGVLPGVTRQHVLAAARRCRIRVEERRFKKAALYSADECFITNTTMEVMPVSRIDKRKKEPGPVTARVGAAFRKLVVGGLLLCAISANGAKGASGHLEEGKRLLEERKLRASVRSFERAVEADPSSAEAYRWLGAAWAEKGLKWRAVDSYRKALSLDPGVPNFDLITQLVLLNDFASAATMLEEAAKADLQPGLKLYARHLRSEIARFTALQPLHALLEKGQTPRLRIEPFEATGDLTAVARMLEELLAASIRNEGRLALGEKPGLGSDHVVHASVSMADTSYYRVVLRLASPGGAGVLLREERTYGSTEALIKAMRSYATTLSRPRPKIPRTAGDQDAPRLTIRPSTCLTFGYPEIYEKALDNMRQTHTTNIAATASRLCVGGIVTVRLARRLGLRATVNWYRIATRRYDDGELPVAFDQDLVQWQFLAGPELRFPYDVLQAGHWDLVFSLQGGWTAALYDEGIHEMGADDLRLSGYRGSGYCVRAGAGVDLAGSVCSGLGLVVQYTRVDRLEKDGSTLYQESSGRLVDAASRSSTATVVSLEDLFVGIEFSFGIGLFR